MPLPPLVFAHGPSALCSHRCRLLEELSPVHTELPVRGRRPHWSQNCQHCPTHTITSMMAAGKGQDRFQSLGQRRDSEGAAGCLELCRCRAPAKADQLPGRADGHPCPGAALPGLALAEGWPQRCLRPTPSLSSYSQGLESIPMLFHSQGLDLLPHSSIPAGRKS